VRGETRDADRLKCAGGEGPTASWSSGQQMALCRRGPFIAWSLACNWPADSAGIVSGPLLVHRQTAAAAQSAQTTSAALRVSRLWELGAGRGRLAALWYSCLRAQGG